MTQEVQHGADEVLRNVFWDLGQIGDKNGPKYPEGVLRRLASKILDGRAHELLAFRLCHLVRCAAFASEDGGPQGWLEFFCAPGAGRSSWAASWLRARLPAHGDAVGPAAIATATDSNVVLHFYGDAPQITISYGAMPLLAAFMEFLLNTLHYRTVRDTLAPLSKPALDWRELQNTANDLSRTVYAWLQAHRRPVQESRDFDAIARFLAAQGDFTTDDIDDEAILVFWRAVSAEPASTFRTYRKTFRAFLRFAEAMRDVALEAGIDSPASLTANGDRGMSDIVDHSSPGLGNMRTSLAVASEWETQREDDTSPLEEVATAAEIKFLLANEAKRLVLVNSHARLLPGLAQSVLRDARFGQAQARISQHLRMKGSVTQNLCTNRPEVHYDDEVVALEKLHSHLERLMDAAAFVLVGKDCVGEGDNVRRLDFKTLAQGRSALTGLRRQGFDGLRTGAPEALEVLRRTAPAIIELHNRLGPLCTRLRAEAPWAARQEQDDSVFRAQFIRIYCTDEPDDGERAR